MAGDFQRLQDPVSTNQVSRAIRSLRSRPCSILEWRSRKARTPTLIQHCEGDERVPIPQGYELYNALKRQGVEMRMLVVPRQGHVPQEPKADLKVIQTTLDWFLLKLLPPGGEVYVAEKAGMRTGMAGGK